jgi:hypothetical protein
MLRHLIKKVILNSNSAKRTLLWLNQDLKFPDTVMAITP